MLPFLSRIKRGENMELSSHRVSHPSHWSRQVSHGSRGLKLTGAATEYLRLSENTAGSGLFSMWKIREFQNNIDCENTHADMESKI